jgi:hypothetical protein
MKPVVLFRGNIEHEAEYNCVQKHIDCIKYRNSAWQNVVFGRYSVLPYYKELETELSFRESRLVNSFDQHEWIASAEWVNCFHNTPRTYTDLNFHAAPEGAYVVKGRTNSRKLQWNKLMAAKSKRQALNIAGDLMCDPLISEQGILYREYVPLQNLGYGLNDLPFVNEWRAFFYKENLIAIGKYWLDVVDHPEYVLTDELKEFTLEQAKTAARFVNFFVLDVAITEQGQPILIEINDAQMSGLQDIDPNYFYQSLAASIASEKWS